MAGKFSLLIAILILFFQTSTSQEVDVYGVVDCFQGDCKLVHCMANELVTELEQCPNFDTQTVAQIAKRMLNKNFEKVLKKAYKVCPRETVEFCFESNGLVGRGRKVSWTEKRALFKKLCVCASSGGNWAVLDRIVFALKTNCFPFDSKKRRKLDQANYFIKAFCPLVRG